MPRAATASAAAETKQEAAAFTDIVESYIAQFIKANTITSDAVEAALIQIESQHTMHINAMKREFNANLDRIEGSRASSGVGGTSSSSAGGGDGGETARIKAATADYKRQLDAISANHQREVQRLKSNYDEILAERDSKKRGVQMMQDGHSKEIARLQAEHERIAGNKDRDIEARQRQIDSMYTNATSEIRETDSKRRASEEESSALRREMTFSQLAIVRKEDGIADLVKRNLEDNEKILLLCKKLMTEVHDMTAGIEVEMSQMRSVMINDYYEAIRKIRETEERAAERAAAAAASASAGTDLATSPSLNLFSAAGMAKEIDTLERYQSQGQAQLEQLMDSIAERQTAQKGALAVFEARVDEELAKARNFYKTKQEEIEEERQKRERENNSISLNNSSRSDVVFPFKDADGKIRDMRVRRARRASSILSINSNAGTSPQRAPGGGELSAYESAQSEPAANSARVDLN